MQAIFELPLSLERFETERLTSGYERETMLVRLHGRGEEGLGEDVSPFGGEFPPFAPPPPLALAGEWTLGSFCAHLGALALWTEKPIWEPMHRYRRWAFESAALDLALRQAARPLPELLGREPRPLRFVNSLGLGDPPSFETMQVRLSRYPGLRFKVDADWRWSPDLIDALAACGKVEIVDFKGRYGLEVQDEAALARMYEHVLGRFPDALLEDPHDLPAIAGLMEPHAARVSFDAPIHEVADIGDLRTINVKPSRIGSLATLFAIYEHCERHGIGMYSGGMGELCSRPRPGAAAGRALPRGCAERHRAERVQRALAHRRPPAEPASAPRPAGFRW